MVTLADRLHLAFGRVGVECTENNDHGPICLAVANDLIDYINNYFAKQVTTGVSDV
jgi:hypothetical protein